MIGVSESNQPKDAHKSVEDFCLQRLISSHTLEREKTNYRGSVKVIHSFHEAASCRIRREYVTQASD